MNKFYFLSFFLLICQINAYYDPTLPLVPMSQYSQNYRTLSCWDCFKARGKMCSRRDGQSMIAVTGSSNRGHGMCCKPEYQGEYCVTNDEYVCSQPVDEEDTLANYTDILTDGELNYQMHAFCPATTEAICGVEDFMLVAKPSV